MSGQTPQDREDLTADQREELVALFQHGQHAILEERMRGLLQSHPHSGFAWMLMGSCLHAQGKDGLPALRQAAQLLPQDPGAHANLGNALADTGHLDEAEQSFRQAARLDPGNPFVHFNLGNTLFGLGRLAEAEASIREALRIHPDHPDMHNNLGNLLGELGRLREAEQSFRRALQLDPRHGPALYNLGNVLRELGQLDEATARCREALELDPQAAENHANLANALKELGQADAAEASYRRALQLDPDLAEAHSNLGNLLRDSGRLEEACASYQQALRLVPQDISSHNNLGVTLKDLGRLDQAEASYRRALEIRPDFAEAHSNLLFAYNYDPRQAPDFCLDEAKRYGQMASGKVGRRYAAWSCPVQPARLRIGLVSGDLRAHPVGYFLEGLLARLDHGRVELVAYATDHRTDTLTERIRPAFSAWKSLVGLPDREAAALIHADGIHVLIDLAGHTAHNRLPVFAWKPAPVQASWLGYFATTGVAEMDYLLVDSEGVPEDQRACFTEALCYLPDTRLCFTPPATDLPVAPLPALHNGWLTFGCFQNLTKVGEGVLALWAKVMAALPEARLRWQCRQLGDPAVARQFRQNLERHGIAGHRVALSGAASREDYLAAHAGVDLILDTFPFPGGTTTCEALWMGVPTLTLAGRSLLERQGASLLAAAGLRDFITGDEAEFVARAQALARDVAALATLRSGLRHRLADSPLFEATRFARGFEKALWEMWRHWEAGNAAALAPPEAVHALPAEALRSLGAEHLQQGRLDEAEAAYREALELEPDFAEAHFKLGNILFAMDRLDAAEACYRRAVELDPDYVKALYNLGNTLRQTGRLDEAEHCYRRVAAIDPHYTNAHNNLGVLLMDQGRHAEAEDVYRQLLSVAPDDAVALGNLGLCQLAQGRLAEAEASLRQALALQPANPEARNNLGVALKQQGRMTEAEAEYRAVLDARPDHAEAHNNLGAVLKAQGRLAEAEDACLAAIEQAPDYVDALNNLGAILKELGRLGEAEHACLCALEADPGCAEAHNNLGTILSDQCRRTEATESFRKALRCRPDYPEAHSNLLFIMNYGADSLPLILAESRRYGELVAARIERPFTDWSCPPNPGRLRVGMVSGDLRNHPVGYFLNSFLAHLDPSRVELIAYPTSRAETELTARLRPHFAAWKTIHGLDDRAAAAMIRDDGVHVLLDLAGHTAHNRLPVFAWKPAPVQAGWLGYCATTGLAAMDYCMADALTLTEAEARNFTESIWRLPQGYLCFSPPGADLPVSAPPALRDGHVTFGSFNNLAKIDAPVVNAWARILAAVPGSRLLLKAQQLGDEAMRERFAGLFAARGVAAERLSLQGVIADRREHLASYGRIDIALDPFPYNGVTTTVEALWAGVPVLTCAGERFLARQGLGLLSSVGLHDWIATDVDDYVAKAAAHATDLPGLAALRAGLRQRVLASPLFDAQRFARDFEDALHGMWQARGEKPATPQNPRRTS